MQIQRMLLSLIAVNTYIHIYTFILIFPDVPASGLYFLTYEYVKDVSAHEFGTEGSRGLIGTIFAGGCAGIANWSVGMPADTLKSRFQTAAPGKYNGTRDVFRELMVSVMYTEILLCFQNILFFFIF